MVFVTPHNAAMTNLQHVRFPVSIILGATIITITGLMDDVFKASPRVKIGGQLIAAAMLAMESVGINLVTECFQAVGVLHPDENLCYILGTVLVALMVVGGCNAMNLLDGMDGLASGTAAIAGLGFLFLAAHVSMNWPSLEHAANPLSDPVRLIMCLAMLGAVLGFLPYNFNPARIFMGDAGSLLLGYLCVTTIMLFGHTAAKAPGYAMAAVIVLGLPITDTTLAIVRRTLRGQPVSMGDKQHLHHQLLARGLSVKQAVLVMYALAAGFAVLGGAMVFLRVRYVLIVFLALFGTVLAAALVVGRRQAQR
jgi:UDP-GlcNAc:undecaprenyl-phosphate GlcNAc-1-phosphate transferase